uniref:[histone H4]-lysine(20) N-methyltransferase n=1 Tax=Hucho hucho TaxID=62062 RepID=A0A4W5NFS4_9TELE
MAKGKKKVLTTNNRPEETLQVKQKTKENKPDLNRDAGNCQPTIQSLRRPSKRRSPLCDYSRSVIQVENVPEKCTLQTEPSKKGKGRLVPRETTTLHVQEEDLKSHPNPTVQDGNITKPKTEKGASQKVKVKKAESNAAQNRKVTDYYSIRRSSRKSNAELKNKEHGHLDYLIKNGVEGGLQAKHIEGKGRGVFAVRCFKKGTFVIEYHGDLLHLADAKEREALYAQDPGTGCYMYYFQYLSKTYCVDATKESTRLGRLLNHSKTGNCQTKLHDIDGIPHLILVASRDIESEEELLYDYGDRSKESISAHPWLKY